MSRDPDPAGAPPATPPPPADRADEAGPAPAPGPGAVLREGVWPAVVLLFGAVTFPFRHAHELMLLSVLVLAILLLAVIDVLAWQVYQGGG